MIGLEKSKTRELKKLVKKLKGTILFLSVEQAQLRKENADLRRKIAELRKSVEGTSETE